MVDKRTVYGYSFPMFNVQCPRCNGTGKYDRGTCFECKGSRSVRRNRKPAGIIPYHFVVTYSNGTTNNVAMYFDNQLLAQLAIDDQIAAKGWEATVNPADLPDTQ